MKKVILMVAAILAVAVSHAQVITTTVDTDNSIVNWKGFKPTGEHFGTITISEGTINIEAGKLTGGTFIFDMNSIIDTDMPADNENNAKLIGHLKSDAFFDVAKYPTAKFTITSVKEKDGKLNVTGDLTIKDQTHSISFPATLSKSNGVSVLTSEVFKVNRADYNVKYGSKSFFDNLKDKFIYDDFDISFVVTTKK